MALYAKDDTDTIITVAEAYVYNETEGAVSSVGEIYIGDEDGTPVKVF